LTVFAVVAGGRANAARRSTRVPRRPPWRRITAVVMILAAVIAASTLASTLAYLRLPATTGAFAVGRSTTLLADPARPEPRTATNDHRNVRLIAWYPAVPGSGQPTEYVPGLEAIRAGLEASGEIGTVQIAGLGLVRANARQGAAVAPAASPYPVVILSPGNATNVAFYASLAEDLASHGFVVVGVDHPYQVAAVDMGEAGVAVYPGDQAAGPPGADIAAKIDERVADIRFVLDRLAEDAAGFAALRDRLDLRRIGIVGHSNGGIAAAEACVADTRLVGCMNIDGQSAGGPFSSRPDPAAPTKPFMYLTKEVQLHEALGALFERAGPDTFRVVVPAATHDAFADGPRFRPRLAPVDGAADAVLTIERGVALAFFDHVLRGAPETVFRAMTAPTDILVEAYPLGDRSRTRAPLP
jgi:dienelactone hydrolase